MDSIARYIALHEHVGPAAVTDGTAPTVAVCSCAFCAATPMIPSACECVCKGCHGRDSCFCPPRHHVVRLWPDCVPLEVIEREQLAGLHHFDRPTRGEAYGDGGGI